MRRAVLLDNDFPDVGYEQSTFAKHEVELTVVPPDPGDELTTVVADADALVLLWTPVSEELIDAAPRLKVIGRYGTGIDMIDVEAATRRGIAVVNSGSYATEEVATHTLALALAQLRQIVAGDRAVRDRQWPPPASFESLSRISTLVAGVVGYGQIGREVAHLFKGVGMDVVALAVDREREAEEDGTRTVTSVDELLEQADVITFHVPLTPQTHHMINADRLRRLKPGAVIVNTSRGGVIDSKALLDALDEGRLSGAALDVFEEEPLPPDSPLRVHPRVVVTPHLAYFSAESLQVCRERTVTAVLDVLDGRVPDTLANEVDLPRAQRHP